MAFKSEIHVAELASIRTGHTEGDIYYILDNGMLDELPCKPGDFVKWHNDAWQALPNEHYALASDVDGEIATAIGNLLDDGSESEAIVVAVPVSQADDYTVGEYYKVQGKVAKLRTKTVGDNVVQLTFDTTTGVLEAINETLENSGKVEAIQVAWDTDHFNYPTYSEIDAIVHTKKKGLCLLVQNPGGSKNCWWVSGKSAASANNYYKFLGERGEELYIYQDGTDKRKYPVVKTGAIAPDYDPTQTYPTVGTAVMQYGTRYVSNTAITTAEAWTPAHWTEKSVEDEIGNVEALLAAL